MDTLRVALSLLATTACLSVAAAPDEDELGKAEGYPHQRMAPDFSLLADKYKIGNFTSMDQIFWPREIASTAPARTLSKAPEAFAVRYEYGGRTFTIEDLLARQRITGLLILKGEAIVYEAYQYDRTATSKFASFSMAKTVVGLLTGIAMGEGRIASLDDPATKYAPDLRGTAYGQASVRDLLRMSSGAKWSDKVVAGQATDIGQLTADTYYRRARGGPSSLQRVRESASAPGTAFNYSSAETFALSLVVKGAVGGDLSAYAAEKLWKPMGAEAPASWLTDWSGAEAAFCCLNARLRDYGRLGMLLASDGEYNGKQIISREFLLDGTDAARQPEYLKPRRATPFFGYGYQTWLYPYRTRTFQARGLFGQEIIVQPSSRIVVVITSALRTPDVPDDIFVERNYFVGAVLKALGGQADVYR
ncbi:MAG: serine hydrolase [Vitreoscilla sp.]|nr:serine hydrolase [Vitreoscilla sp.]